MPKIGYLPTLDGWRAIAILAVLLDHATEYSSLGRQPRVVAFTHTGPNGVSLFFAISGFLNLLPAARGMPGLWTHQPARILHSTRLPNPAASNILSPRDSNAFPSRIIVVTQSEWWSSLLFFS